jgi:predicted secreted protein
MKKFSICLLMLLVIVFIFPGAGQAKLAQGDYIDLKGHWAEQDILFLDQLGIMQGTGTNEQGYKIFAPGSLVTRAQMAKVLTDTFQLDYGQLRFFKQPVASDYYRDVDNNSWYADAVVMFAINEIFYARDEYNFEPAVQLSRMEAAQAIYRSFNAKNISIPMIMMMPVYNDTQDLGQEDMNAMVFVSNTGIMKGDGQNFRPDDLLTRAELAKIIGRCIELICLNENNNGQNYSIKVGQEFILSLDSNPTTGYVWDFDKSYDDKLLEVKVDKAYTSDTTVNENIVGQGGRTYWKFKALQAGTAEIELGYARPWESVPPAKTIKITINISDGSDSVGTESIAIQTKAYNNLAKYMETNLRIPCLQGMNDAALQTKLNDRFEQDAFAIEKSLLTEAEEYVKEAQAADFPIRNFSLYSRFQQGYLNSRILSLTVDYYQYTGGAHGITERRPYNIDLGTGQDLALKDLFTSNFDYRSVINKEISRQIDSNKDMYFEGDMGFQGISEDQDYYLQDDALVVVFQQYEIAPYAAGIPEFIIPLNLFGDNFRTDLLTAAK